MKLEKNFKIKSFYNIVKKKKLKNFKNKIKKKVNGWMTLSRTMLKITMNIF